MAKHLTNCICAETGLAVGVWAVEGGEGGRGGRGGRFGRGGRGCEEGKSEAEFLDGFKVGCEDECE